MTTPVSEAVERVADYVADDGSPLGAIYSGDLTDRFAAFQADLRAILADHARLTEQVRVARDGLTSIAEHPGVNACNEAHIRSDEAAETLTRMEKNDGQ